MLSRQASTHSGSSFPEVRTPIQTRLQSAFASGPSSSDYTLARSSQSGMTDTAQNGYGAERLSSFEPPAGLHPSHHG